MGARIMTMISIGWTELEDMLLLNYNYYYYTLWLSIGLSNSPDRLQIIQLWADGVLQY